MFSAAATTAPSTTPAITAAVAAAVVMVRVGVTAPAAAVSAAAARLHRIDRRCRRVRAFGHCASGSKVLRPGCSGRMRLCRVVHYCWLASPAVANSIVAHCEALLQVTCTLP
jgi:hypothetical protein